MAHDIQTEITISAPAQRVWEVLTDGDALPSWNPVLVKMEGPLTRGGPLRIAIKLGVLRLPLRVTLTKVDHAEALEWATAIPGIFKARHGFRLEALPNDHTRFVHYETFSGAVIPLLGRLLANVEREYRRMNEALKTRVEA